MSNIFLITPSMFCDFPYGSIKQNNESETIAWNIMIILRRNGDKFKDLSWEEYKKERIGDGNFEEKERGYFDSVQYLSRGDSQEIRKFSPSWDKAYHNKFYKHKNLTK